MEGTCQGSAKRLTAVIDLMNDWSNFASNYEAMLKEKIAQSMSYEDYRRLVTGLVAEGKTTGPKQSEDLAHYTSLNEHRMKRLDKTTQLNPELVTALEAIDRKQTWLVLTEGWCGDAAQILPMLAKMADAAPNVELRLVLRDEHLDLMDQYLTNGGRSIPKLIVVDAETYEEKGTWGPRPAVMQEMVMARKNDPNAEPYSEFVKKAQLWYARDKTQSTQAELLAFLND